ncbi:MAG TPA: DUF4345 domain-containing protein [Allosphingosinicella sp.]|jgi:hypothetical protein
MDLGTERRLLQLATAAGSMVPLLAGLAGMLQGPEMIRGMSGVPADLDSHYRYLSGLLCGIGLGFLSCIGAVEERGRRFQLLGAIVLVGGLGRLLSAIELGLPGLPHRLALGMETAVMAALMLWQWRVARRWRRSKQAPDVA